MEPFDLESCFIKEVELPNDFVYGKIASNSCFMGDKYLCYTKYKLFIYNLTKKECKTHVLYPKEYVMIVRALSRRVFLLYSFFRAKIYLWDLKKMRRIKTIKLSNAMAKVIIVANENTLLAIDSDNINVVHTTDNSIAKSFRYCPFYPRGPHRNTLIAEKVNDNLIMIYHQLETEYYRHPSIFIVDWTMGRVVTMIDNFYFFLRYEYDNIFPFIDCRTGKVYTTKYKQDFLKKKKGKSIMDVPSLTLPTFIDKDVNEYFRKTTKTPGMNLPKIFFGRFAVIFGKDEIKIIDLKKDAIISECKTTLKCTMKILDNQNYICLIGYTSMQIFRVNYDKINQFLLNYLHYEKQMKGITH